MRMTRAASLVAVCVLAAACSKSGTTTQTGTTEIGAEVASYELVAGEPNRFLVGLIAADNRLVSYGTVKMAFAFVGTEKNPVSPEAGAPKTGRFILVPPEDSPVITSGEISQAQEKAPELTAPDVARGVYQASGVSFDKPGFWQVEVTVDLDDLGKQAATASFQVVDNPSYPAVGERAPQTNNLTLKSHLGAPLTAVDSRAAHGKVPDPGLHQWTVSKAISEGKPVLVVVSTPVYCISRFCGPITDEVAGLEKTYGDQVAFVHIEVWKDHDKNVVNVGAADWVLRHRDLTEPWVFLVDTNGKIVDRWQNVLDVRELESRLQTVA
ncbi:MAG: hypothetical protein WD757_07925 [Actinomycetota bacterium]